MGTMQFRTTAAKLTIVTLLVMLAFGLVSSQRVPSAASAQPTSTTVLDWNRHAVEVFHNPTTAPTPGMGMPPQVSVLHIAMVQGAIYDAVNTIDGGYQPYSTDLPAADESASLAAAAATAAHHVIVGVVIQPALSPEIVARVDTLYQESIDAATDADGADAVAAGIAAGEAAAAAMLESRANDGRYVPVTVEAGAEPGDWRQTPPSNAQDPFAWVGLVTPFTMNSPEQFRSRGPNAVDSGIYAREYNEVKKLGAQNSQRTNTQNLIAQFYTANPTELFNRAFRTIAESEGLSIAEQARLFAMLNMSGADALINCFNDKLYYNTWRPITAIQLGDEDGNDKTAGDPTWTPMVNTPAYSEHSSGYNCITAAFMETAANFFGTQKFSFSLVKITPGQPDVTMNYRRFKDVYDDTIDARIYQGIHFRTSDAQGVELGKDVAHWLNKKYFKSVE